LEAKKDGPITGLMTPLLISPHGGKTALLLTPSPVGEVPIAIGRDGGYQQNDRNKY